MQSTQALHGEKWKRHQMSFHSLLKIQIATQKQIDLHTCFHHLVSKNKLPCNSHFNNYSTALLMITHQKMNQSQNSHARKIALQSDNAKCAIDLQICLHYSRFPNSKRTKLQNANFRIQCLRSITLEKIRQSSLK